MLLLIDKIPAEFFNETLEISTLFYCNFFLLHIFPQLNVKLFSDYYFQSIFSLCCCSSFSWNASYLNKIYWKLKLHSVHLWVGWMGWKRHAYMLIWRLLNEPPMCCLLNCTWEEIYILISIVVAAQKFIWFSHIRRSLTHSIFH